MPKFTQQELEEIQRNTERIEQERRHREKESQEGRDSAAADSLFAATSKSSKKNKTTKKSSSVKRSRSKGDYSVMERMIAVILLILTILISYAVMVFS